MNVTGVDEVSQVAAARMSYVWVKAHLDYIPNRGVTRGPGNTWNRMDPSLKRFEVAGGLRLDETAAGIEQKAKGRQEGEAKGPASRPADTSRTAASRPAAGCWWKPISRSGGSRC